MARYTGQMKSAFKAISTRTRRGHSLKEKLSGESARKIRLESKVASEYSGDESKGRTVFAAQQKCDADRSKQRQVNVRAEHFHARQPRRLQDENHP
jgi:hypothetical protein